jgi:hypothetical protein
VTLTDYNTRPGQGPLGLWIIKVPQGEASMAILNHGRVKRVHAEFRGDEAVELEILEVMLRMGEVSRSRIDIDTRMVRLAFKALERMIADYAGRTGQRYPTYLMLFKHLDEREAPAQAEPTRVVSIQK